MSKLLMKTNMVLSSTLKQNNSFFRKGEKVKILFRFENLKDDIILKKPQLKKRTRRNTIENKARLCQNILSSSEQNYFLDQKSYKINTPRQSEESGIG